MPGHRAFGQPSSALAMDWIASWVDSKATASEPWQTVRARLETEIANALCHKDQLSFHDIYTAHQYAFAPFGTFVDPMTFALAIYIAPIGGTTARSALIELVKQVANPEKPPASTTRKRLGILSALGAGAACLTPTGIGTLTGLSCVMTSLWMARRTWREHNTWVRSTHCGS
jgi:hypothetical protein